MTKKVEVTKQELTTSEIIQEKNIEKNKDYYYKNISEQKLDKGYWTKVEKNKNKMKKLKFIKEKDTP